jgi:hypothetical protein
MRVALSTLTACLCASGPRFNFSRATFEGVLSRAPVDAATDTGQLTEREVKPGDIGE